MALSRGVSKIIGLGTEAYAHHKDKKAEEEANSGGNHGATNAAPTEGRATLASPNTSGHHHESSDTDFTSDEDEADWICDETQTELKFQEDGPSSKYEGHSVDSLVADFIHRHPPPPTEAKAPLLNPVIIPQRRPGTKFRGFVPAYAPALATCGVDEQAFMEFHEGMHKAVTEQGWFHVSNIAIGISVIAYTAAVAPSIIVHSAAVVVHTSIEASRRMWMSKRTNSYLDQMNDKYFKPRGLFALVMTYRPGSNDADEWIDAKTNSSSAVAARNDHQRSSFKTSSGKTFGEGQLPPAAPLIFPKLEKADDEEKQNAFKRATAFMGAYGDKRANAEFREKAPDSQLNVTPKPEFSSRFADPTDPVNKGLLPMLRGNRSQDHQGPIRARREARGKPTLASRLESRRERKSEMGGKTSVEGPTGTLGKVKRKMHEDVLYLMVVEMPSDEELKTAAEMMEQAKKAGFKG